MSEVATHGPSPLRKTFCRYVRMTEDDAAKAWREWLQEQQRRAMAHPAWPNVVFVPEPTADEPTSREMTQPEGVA